jgi:phytoene dehydrogenase-like protein
LDDKNPQDWSLMRDTARRIVLERLAQAGIVGLEDHIKFEHVYTPDDWIELFNLTRGSTLGLGHNLLQMAYLRPKNRHKRYENLYFVGSHTHPGSGVPTVLISGRVTAERIIQEQPLN